MRTIGAFLIACMLLLIACQQKKQWYEGGTLHNATAAQWRTSDESNKLATCADFAANIKKAKGETYTDLDSMKADAVYYLKFLDEATKPPTIDSQKVAELVATQAVINR